MRADFPTLGRPTTTARAGLGARPLLALPALALAAAASAAFFSSATLVPFSPSVQIGATPPVTFSLKKASHSLRSAAETWSQRLRTRMRGLPVGC